MTLVVVLILVFFDTSPCSSNEINSRRNKVHRWGEPTSWTKDLERNPDVLILPAESQQVSAFVHHDLVAAAGKHGKGNFLLLLIIIF